MPPLRRCHPRLLMLVIAVLTALLGLGGLSSPAGAVEGAAPTTTVLTVAPVVGDTVTLTAQITTSAGPVPVGEVFFVADASEDVWDSDASVSLGTASVDAEGTASLQVAVTTAMMPFLEAGTPFYLAADYEPYQLNGVGIYDGQYASSLSAPVSVAPPASPVPTRVMLITPGTAVVGDQTMVTATVSPSAAGTIEISDPSGRSSERAAIMTVPWTPTSTGVVTVTATFVPDDSEAYQRSYASIRVEVVARPSVTTSSAAVSASGTSKPVGQASMTASGCIGPATSARSVAGPAAATGSSGNATFTGAMQLPAVIGIAAGAAVVTGVVVHQTTTYYGPCPAARTSLPRRATRTTGTCRWTTTGFACPLGSLPANTAFRVTVRFPLPAQAAGKRIRASGTVTETDPVTGATTTLATTAVTVKVPKRTVLQVRLAPTKPITAVKRGKRVAYRVLVRNLGVVRASGVRACAKLGPGARVRTAHGGTVHGHRVCWTLPTLKKGKQVARKVTLVAPPRKGRLKVALAVVPRKHQASPVRLTTHLRVR